MSRTPIAPTPKARILAAVVALHAVLIVGVLMAPAARRPIAGATSIEVMLIPATRISRVRARLDHPQRISSNVVVALAPPLLAASALPGAAAGTERDESGVDWTAEAHRAIRAFEIRRDETSNRALSVASSPDYVPPTHRAGQRTKTPSGDWIVWIDADCYQVAGWHAGAAAVDTAPPATVCVKDDDRSAPAAAATTP